MKNTYLKPSTEIIRMETGAFLQEWRISIPKDAESKDVEYGGAVGAKRNNQGADDDNTNAPQPVAPAFPPSIWDD